MTQFLQPLPAHKTRAEPRSEEVGGLLRQVQSVNDEVARLRVALHRRSVVDVAGGESPSSYRIVERAAVTRGDRAPTSPTSADSRVGSRS